LKLSVVILNYNVEYFLNLCIQSVQRATKNIDAEIIVVDNASKDGSMAMIQENYPEITCIANTVNYGFPKGNNMGVHLAKGEYVCILNPDTVVAEDTFEKFLEFHKKTPNCGIVGPKLIDGSGHFLPESKRGLSSPSVAFTKVLGLYKISKKWFGKYYASHLSENQTGRVDMLVGACMFLKTSLYKELGGFDENFFMYLEDDDFSYRSLKAGYHNYFLSETTVIHYKGESTPKNTDYQLRFQKGLQCFFNKHFTTSIFTKNFLSIGIAFFTVFKRFSSSYQESQQISQPSHYALITKDSKFVKQFSKSTLKPVSSFSSILNMLQTSIPLNTEIIFDMDLLPIKDIMFFMQSHKNPYTFKIKAENSHVMIGSNNAVCRGEILMLGESHAKKLQKPSII